MIISALLNSALGPRSAKDTCVPSFIYKLDCHVILRWKGRDMCNFMLVVVWPCTKLILIYFGGTFCFPFRCNVSSEIKKRLFYRLENGESCNEVNPLYSYSGYPNTGLVQYFWSRPVRPAWPLNVWYSTNVVIAILDFECIVIRYVCMTSTL